MITYLWVQCSVLFLAISRLWRSAKYCWYSFGQKLVKPTRSSTNTIWIAEILWLIADINIKYLVHTNLFTNTFGFSHSQSWQSQSQSLSTLKRFVRRPKPNEKTLETIIMVAWNTYEDTELPRLLKSTWRTMNSNEF